MYKANQMFQLIILIFVYLYYIILLTSLSSMPIFDTLDFNIPPVGNPRGIFTLTVCISFDVESLICINFLLTETNFIEPLKILEY